MNRVQMEVKCSFFPHFSGLHLSGFVPQLPFCIVGVRIPTSFWIAFRNISENIKKMLLLLYSCHFHGSIALQFLCNLLVPVEIYLGSAHVYSAWPLCPGSPHAAWSSNVNAADVFLPYPWSFPRENGNVRNYAAIIL